MAFALLEPALKSSSQKNPFSNALLTSVSLWCPHTPRDGGRGEGGSGLSLCSPPHGGGTHPVAVRRGSCPFSACCCLQEEAMVTQVTLTELPSGLTGNRASAEATLVPFSAGICRGG